METDSFFWQLFKHLPETIFELIDEPVEQVKNYRFDSVEVKKSYRIDGMLVPRRPRQPIYFIEVSFFRQATFYANLFAKVFGYLEENRPEQDWRAVAIFASRKCEPKALTPYRDLLEQLVDYLVHNVAVSIADSDKRLKVVQLVEELLLRRFTGMNREEIRTMFKLHDIRKSRVWQEAAEEGRKEGRQKDRAELARKWLANGMTLEAIAQLLFVNVENVKRLLDENDAESAAD